MKEGIEKDYPNLTEMDAYAHRPGWGVPQGIMCNVEELNRLLHEVETLRAANAAKDKALKAADELAEAVRKAYMTEPGIPVVMRNLWTAYRIARAKVAP